MALTRLDVLSILPRLKICIGYELDGQRIDYLPQNITALNRCQPVYEELPGWQTPISDILDYQRLPVEARHYVARLEELTSCPANIISVGAKREQTIHKTPIF